MAYSNHFFVRLNIYFYFLIIINEEIKSPESILIPSKSDDFNINKYNDFNLQSLNMNNSLDLNSHMYFFFEYIYLEKIFKNNISYKSWDPFTTEKKILNSKPMVLNKSELAEHICFKNNFSFFAEKKGVICIMKNFFLIFSNWKQDGYIYIGPVNKKTRGQTLISKGFFKI